MRDERGRMLPGYAGPALQRFASRCRFDPGTGCVVWTGGTTSGQGHSVLYGSFWFEGRRWFAHRWAAKHIHGLEIDDHQVDHCCPNILMPNTLCVEHVQALTLHENRLLQTERRRFFALVTKGVEEAPGVVTTTTTTTTTGTEVPFYAMPEWLEQCSLTCNF